jgi:pre-mRNA-splicing factor SYF2
MPPKRKSARKGKNVEKAVEEPPADEQMAENEPAAEEPAIQEEENVPKMPRKAASEPPASTETAEESTPAGSGAATPSSGVTIEDRQAKLQQLREKMRSTAQANRKDLVAEHNRQKTTVKEQIRQEKQRKLAETLREKVEAEETGEDLERKKNWEWSIEENDAWEKKKARKAKRADFQFHDDQHAAQLRYKKDLDHLKPDLEAYNRQKEAALGLVPGTLSTKKGEGQIAVASSSSSGSALAAFDDLYRDANSLVYADNKPSEEAIDRVISKLNIDLDKRAKHSRKRLNEDEGDITYINERNRVFNKKIARYYDKYTAEIRASFERGTAL